VNVALFTSGRFAGVEANGMRQIIQQVASDRAAAARRLAKFDAVLANLTELYPDAVREATASVEANANSDENPNDGSAIDAAESPTPITSTRYAALSSINGRNDFLTVKEMTDEALGSGWRPPASTADPVAVMRTAVSRLYAEKLLERRMRDGRTAEYRIPNNAAIVESVSRSDPPENAVEENPASTGDSIDLYGVSTP